MRVTRIFAMSLAASLSIAAAACSPALDWRDFVAEGSGLHVAFPCRPDRSSRRVDVAGSAVTMELLSCRAGETTFAISFFDLADPAQVTGTLAAWRAIALRNVQGRDPRSLPLQVAGTTPNPVAGRHALTGRRPDGTPLNEQVAFFVHGLRLYQATVIGPEPPAEAFDGFFDALALAPDPGDPAAAQVK